jgi:hypothetical protein
VHQQSSDRRGDTTYYNPKPKKKYDDDMNKVYRIRGTAGGDRINYDGPTKANTAALSWIICMLFCRKETIDLSGFGNVPVLAVGTMRSSAVSERGAIKIDVKGSCCVGARDFRIDVGVVIGQVRALEAFDDRSSVDAGTMSGVAFFQWQMLPDHFWSVVLLRSLNSHALFRDVLQKTQKFLRTHEHDPPSRRLPIFTYTSAYTQNLQSDQTLNSGKPTSTSEKPPYPGRSTHNQYKSQSLPAGVEQAAAATAPTFLAKTVSIATTPPTSAIATTPIPSRLCRVRNRWP